MAKFLALQIKMGKLTIDEVPLNLKDQVELILAEG